MDHASRKAINETNPGSEKKFQLDYLLVEKRQVTVTARTVEEAFKKATKEVDRRHKWITYNKPFRYDDKFIIRHMNFLKDGVKKFAKAPWNSVERTNDTYKDLVIEPADLEPLDNTNQAA